MTIGISIVHFVIKVPKLVQMIVTIYRVQAYQVPIVNPRWPPRNLGFFWHFNIRPRWFPAHHRIRLVLVMSVCLLLADVFLKYSGILCFRCQILFLNFFFIWIGHNKKARFSIHTNLLSLIIITQCCFHYEK